MLSPSALRFAGASRGRKQSTTSRSRHVDRGRAQPPVRAQLDDDKRRAMENELKDSRGPFEFFFPRPLRKVLWATVAASSALSGAVGAAKLSASPALEMATGGGENLAVNVAVFAATAAAFVWEGQDEAARVERREANKEKQLKSGVREAYTAPDGSKSSRLKQVDDKWIVNRLERWGAQDQLPMVGPKKGAILQDLIREHRPRRVLEVGTFLGYSAILMAQAVPEGSKVFTIERDWKFVLSARRFLWQCNQGERAPGEPRIGQRVKVLQGEACETLRKLAQDPAVEKFDFFFIDGTPKESLAYLKAAEPLLAPGAVVVCDNVQVFEKSMKDYLDYVRAGGGYSSSRFIQSTFEWRDDVPDGMEVSTWQG